MIMSESGESSTLDGSAPDIGTQNYWVINPRFDFMEERRNARR